MKNGYVLGTRASQELSKLGRDGAKEKVRGLSFDFGLGQRFTTFFDCGPPYSNFLYSVDPLLLTVIQNFEFCGPLRGPWTPGWEPDIIFYGNNTFQMSIGSGF